MILLVLLCSVVTLSGCVGYTIRPPESVQDPIDVHIVDYGDTSRLWLPRDEGGYTEWGYGDWRWYANDKKSLLYGSVVFTWPTAGTLGRRERDAGPFGVDGVPSAGLAGYATHVMTFEAERERVEALRRILNERYDAGRDTEIQNEARKMSFVKDGSVYWFGRQSSSEVAGWAKQLGCDVSGYSIRAKYHLREPGTTTPVIAGDVH